MDWEESGVQSKSAEKSCCGNCYLTIRQFYLLLWKNFILQVSTIRLEADWQSVVPQPRTQSAVPQTQSINPQTPSASFVEQKASLLEHKASLLEHKACQT